MTPEEMDEELREQERVATDSEDGLDAIERGEPTEVLPPRTVECPSAETRTWRPVLENGIMAYRDAQGVLWVPARADEPAEIVLVYVKIGGLPPSRFVRAENSYALKSAKTRERKRTRELRARGYTI